MINIVCAEKTCIFDNLDQVYINNIYLGNFLVDFYWGNYKTCHTLL